MPSLTSNHAAGTFGLQQHAHWRFSSTCTPSAISSAVTSGRGEHRADHAGVAVCEKGTHGIVDVNGVMRAVSDGGARLFVGWRQCGRWATTRPALRAASMQGHRAQKFREAMVRICALPFAAAMNCSSRSADGSFRNSEGWTPAADGADEGGPSKWIPRTSARVSSD